MELGPAQICTACTPFIYLLLLHFLLIFLLLKNDTVAQIAHLQSHFYLPYFSNMEIEKKIQKILPKQKNGLLFNQVLMCKYYSKRFFTLFSYFLLRVFLFSLKNTWPPNGYFSNEKRRCLPSNGCFWNRSFWKGKPPMNTLYESNLIFLLSAYVYS